MSAEPVPRMMWRFFPSGDQRKLVIAVVVGEFGELLIWTGDAQRALRLPFTNESLLIAN